MRQMRLSKREITGCEELKAVIRDCEVVRIGCQDTEGMFIVPVNFGFEYENGQLKLYVHSAKEGRKAEAFDKEPPVAIEMDCAGPLITGEYTCNYSMAYRSIMGNGIIRKVKNNDEKTKALTLLMNKLDAQAEIHFLDKQLEAVNVYCIEVSSFTGKKREPK